MVTSVLRPLNIGTFEGQGLRTGRETGLKKSVYTQRSPSLYNSLVQLKILKAPFGRIERKQMKGGRCSCQFP